MLIIYKTISKLFANSNPDIHSFSYADYSGIGSFDIPVSGYTNRRDSAECTFRSAGANLSSVSDTFLYRRGIRGMCHSNFCRK